MSWWQLLLIGVASALAVYVILVFALVAAGRAEAARAVATFVPDCLVLFERLLRDPRVPLRYKLLIAALIPYLALPFDLVPDFIPVAGYLDDALLVALLLGCLLRGSDRAVIAEHWPGPQESLQALLRLSSRESRRRSSL